MSEMPTEDYEHTEHAMHAKHESEGGNKFIGTVAMSIAVLAVVAATVGSLETLEDGDAISAKNEAVLLQNKATDSWNFYQAKSIKLSIVFFFYRIHCGFGLVFRSAVINKPHCIVEQFHNFWKCQRFVACKYQRFNMWDNQ